MKQIEEYSCQERDVLLIGLLDHIAATNESLVSRWEQWQITRVRGSSNNLLYRATSDHGTLAIKFTIRDTRDRAGREYATLHVLQHCGLDIAPRALFLDRERYAQPVVVQTWLEGAVKDAPPTTDTDWDLLLHHFAAIHTIRRDSTALRLPQAVLTMTNADSGKKHIQQQLDHIPPQARSAELDALMHQLETISFQNWTEPSLTLCRCDPNILNIIRRPGKWASVDWEYSGWGDPAFEIADLMAHPSYALVPAARWEWLINAYSAMYNDDISFRIRSYYLLIVIWWVTRLSRRLYEIPLGLEQQRLAERPTDWLVDIQAKHNRYINLATSLLQRPPPTY